MSSKRLLISSTLLLSLYGCKTQQEIAREQQMKHISVQVVENQKSSADINGRIQMMEDRMNRLQGSLEEQGHHQAQTENQKLKNMEEKILILEQDNKNLNGRLDQIQSTLKEQKEYLDQVIQALSKLSESKPVSSGKKKSEVSSKENNKESNASGTASFDEAMEIYNQGKYKTAKKLLVPLLDDSGLNDDQRARVIHNLGMIDFMHKKDDSALVYFSKLFTDYPKSSYNKNGMLHLAKTFKRQNKNSEAKQILDELVKRYPSSKQAKEAREVMETL